MNSQSRDPQVQTRLSLVEDASFQSPLRCIHRHDSNSIKAPPASLFSNDNQIGLPNAGSQRKQTHSSPKSQFVIALDYNSKPSSTQRMKKNGPKSGLGEFDGSIADHISDPQSTTMQRDWEVVRKASSERVVKEEGIPLSC